VIPQLRSGLLIVSFVVFGVAAYTVANGSSKSLASPDRPIIHAQWTASDSGWLLTGKVTASGLKTTDQLTIQIRRLVDNGDPAPPSAAPTLVSPSSTSPTVAPPSASATRPPPRWPPHGHWVYEDGTIYAQQVGADVDGRAAVDFSMLLPLGYDGLRVVATLGKTFDCGVPIERAPDKPWSCLTLDAPDAQVSTAPATATATN
jgi:hypothetical protein